jgi:hypothetical protein
MDDLAKFEQLVQFRVPSHLFEAIDVAAKRRCQSKSDYLRQSIVDGCIRTTSKSSSFGAK